MTDNVLLERDGALATVILNRPDKLNALTRDMWHRLGEIMVTLSAANDVRCIIVRGAGEEAFSPGNDIAEFQVERHDLSSARDYAKSVRISIDAIKQCRHPTLAMIHGSCMGGGLEIAALCDIRICGAGARFGTPLNRIGLVMTHAQMAALVGLIGRATALEMLLEGRTFDAIEAHEKGLVHRVVDDSALIGSAYASARSIAAGAPLVARWHKKFLNRLADPTPLSVEERDEAYLCFGTADFKEGCEAFLAKRKPQFIGR